MKKIVMTFVAAVMAVSASAQVYVGGNVGIASYDPGMREARARLFTAFSLRLVTASILIGLPVLPSVGARALFVRTTSHLTAT